MKTAYCFDLDGTVTRDELLPVLSKEVGLYEEMSALTEATIKGIIPFRKSFLLRCRLLNEIPISRVQVIVGKIPVYKNIASFIQKRVDHCFIITGNLDAWIAPLAAQLGCHWFSSHAETKDDHLSSVSQVLDKGDIVKSLRRDYDRVIAVGDGMGDVPMFEHANVGIAFGGTHDPIQTLIQFSDYITYEENALCRLLNTL